jgi:hypothetical protein
MACVEYTTTLAELAIGSTTLQILFVHYRLTCVIPSDTMNKIHNTILGLQGFSCRQVGNYRRSLSGSNLEEFL